MEGTIAAPVPDRKVRIFGSYATHLCRNDSKARQSTAVQMMQPLHNSRMPDGLEVDMRFTWLCLLLLLPISVWGGPELDLPIEPVKLGDKIGGEKPVEPEPVETGDDPRDTPPPVFYGEEIVGEIDTIYYVVDASGSMGSDGWSLPGQPGVHTRQYIGLDGNITRGNRWDRARTEAVRSIRGLSENFKFGILIYNCSTVVWKNELQSATDANKQAVEAWLMKQHSYGLTGTGPATVAGLTAAPDTVVLLTDGMPNCGAPGMSGHRRMIVSHNFRLTPIHVFGIQATDHYRAFCQGVAVDSGGSYTDIP